MKKSILLLTMLITSSFIAPNSFAATSEVTWGDYKKFRDIEAGNENRKSFRERTFKQLEQHFTKLAEGLAQDQVLKIEVTDVDLAGDTRFSGINQMRIVKENYFPRMNFSYELLDSAGTVIKTDTVVIKDMNFMSGSSLKYRHESLGYEKKMLDDWFADTFKELIVEK